MNKSIQTLALSTLLTAIGIETIDPMFQPIPHLHAESTAVVTVDQTPMPMATGNIPENVSW